MRAAAFVQSYFDAWNDSDPEGVAHHLSADGIYLDIPENEESTREELIVDLEQFFSDNRHRYELIGEILEGRSTVAFQYRMNPLRPARQGGPGGSIHGAEFMALGDDAAVTITDYYETPGTARPPGQISLPSAVRKYAKSGLSAEQLAAYKNRLEGIMRVERVYLQPDLTLPDLAKRVDCSVNHLSQVINAGFGMSFFDYVNRYRVDYAKGLLMKADGEPRSILNVAFSVGFNSNSAFYTAFRKFVGEAPAHYRRARLDE